MELYRFQGLEITRISMDSSLAATRRRGHRASRCPELHHLLTSYAQPIQAGIKCSVKCFLERDVGDILCASYVYHLDDMQKSVMVKEYYGRRNYQKAEGSVGGQYGIDPQTTTKSRLNKSGKLAAPLQHELKPNNSNHLC